MAALSNPQIAYRLQGSSDLDWTLLTVADGSFPESFTVTGGAYEVKTMTWSESAQFSLTYSPSFLFAANEPGVWYDPSDMSTLFQDAAGTTPVTAVEQPVGLIMDKSEQQSWVDVTGAVWTKTAGDGVVTVSGSQITITGATTATHVNRTAGSIPFAPGVARMSIRADYSDATGVSTWLRGSPSGLANGVVLRGSVGLTNSSLERLDVSTGTVTFTVLSFDYWVGNHATQPTATARPVLSARYNLLTKTEDFGNAAWTKQDVTVAGDVLTFTTTNSRIFQAVARSFTSGQTIICSFEARAGSASSLVVGLNGLTSTGNNPPSIPEITQPLTTSWARYTIVFTVNATDSGLFLIFGWCGGALLQEVGAVELRKVQLEPGSTATPHQRVNTATDYDADPAKFKPYLRFDGVDDFLVTNTITPGTDKVQVFAGISSLSSGTAGFIVESGQNFNPGGIAIYRYSNNTYGLQGHNGSGFMGYVTSAIPADASKVLAMGYDIAASGSREAEALFSRVNGVTDRSVAEGPWTDGNGNFALNALYIGRRGGTSWPFNGQMYSMIVRFGSTLSNEQITQTENWVNEKTGAY